MSYRLCVKLRAEMDPFADLATRMTVCLTVYARTDATDTQGGV